MDFGIGGKLFSRSNDSREENSNCNNASFAWDSWKSTASSSTNSRLIKTLYATAPLETATAAASTRQEEASLANALMFNLPQVSPTRDAGDHPLQRQHPLYAGDASLVNPDPHLTCLKLGKRHYFEDANGSSSGDGGDELFFGSKRGKCYYGSSSGGGGGGSLKTAVVVPRCQVEGCHVALLNAKEYHRRHKVCEMHSKAPQVLVLGLEQRFCQQCSRFHVLSEFDDSKRSCRRRLAGHNERRRKSSHDSVARDSHQDNKMVGGGIAYTSSAECARSLLSAKSGYSWLAPAHDLSSRCSAALRELIVENRAAIMASRQLGFDRDLYFSHHHAVEEFKQMQPAAESHYFPQQNQHHM